MLWLYSLGPLNATILWALFCPLVCVPDRQALDFLFLYLMFYHTIIYCLQFSKVPLKTDHSHLNAVPQCHFHPVALKAAAADKRQS